ncbi:MAG: universal stress protein [Pontiellaceae bacterium]|jgi:nucleotide-binding universal stress UspA family protein|nr:universal stress protein [Pontiellaceae bacterium]
MKKILVAVDLSQSTGKVVEQAMTLAKSMNASVWVVHVTPDKLQVYPASQLYDFPSAFVSEPPGDIEMARTLCAEEYRREHQSLLHLSQKFRNAGIAAQAILMKGDAVDLILKQAEDMDVNIIVMGSHGHGLLHKVLVGSVTEGVLRGAFCNVFIVPVQQK